MSEQKIETKGEVAKDQKGLVTFWNNEWSLADKAEEAWRKYAQHCVDVYEGENQNRLSKNESGIRKNEFNILWSNTETLKPALYNSTPRPDIRRRFRDKDPIARAGAEVLERGATYSIDSYDFDAVVQDVIHDYLLTGRGAGRIRYLPTFTQTTGQDGKPAEVVGYQEVKCELVPWDKLRFGYSRRWEDLPWMGFELELTRDELVKLAPQIGNKVTLDLEPKGDSAAAKADQFKRARVYEIWDKAKRQVLFIAPGYEHGPLSVLQDPLKLKDFWPMPRPLYSIHKTTSLVPTAEYSLYEAQAEELDRITKRINRIINALKVRGVYDATIGEMADVMSQDDNGLVPAKDVAKLYNTGGLEKAIWLLPIDKIITVLRELVQQREAIKAVIYELTGISDILRGASDPGETLGAQQIKENWAGLRLKNRQKEVQRWIRDVIRLKSEIIAEQYSPANLRMMSGLDLPTDADKAKAQVYVQQAQQSNQPPDPKAAQMLAVPSWEQVIAVIRNDASRCYRIDIETNSTIEATEQQDQKSISEMLNAMGGFMSSMLPAVQSQLIPAPAAKALMLSVVRRFKLGREVEDEIDKMGGQPVMDPAELEQKAKELEAMEQQLTQREEQLQQAGMELQGKGLELQKQELAYESNVVKREAALTERELQLQYGNEVLKVKTAQQKDKEAPKPN